MKKYYLIVTYPTKRTLTLYSIKDFRKCKKIIRNGRILLIVNKERIVDLTNASSVLMGKS